MYNYFPEDINTNDPATPIKSVFHSAEGRISLRKEFHILLSKIYHSKFVTDKFALWGRKDFDGESES